MEKELFQTSESDSGKKTWIILIAALLANAILTPILLWRGVDVFPVYALVLWAGQCFIYFAVPKAYLSKVYWVTLYLFGLAAILGIQLHVVRAVSRHREIVFLPTEFSSMISQMRSSIVVFLTIFFIASICFLLFRKDKLNLFLAMNALGALALWECANSMIGSVIPPVQMPIIYDSILHFDVAIASIVGICFLLVICRCAFSKAKGSRLHS